MSENRELYIDFALMAEGIKACHELFQHPPRDFVTVALGAADMVGMPVYDLRSCLRSWYTLVRDALEASGVPVLDASTSAEVDEAMVWLNRWMPSLPRGRTRYLQPIGQNPAQESLRGMMAQALSTPTPEAVIDFARNAQKQKAFGPYNILMIYAQRPGAGLVASKARWRAMGRDVREGAIPILILYPKGPIRQVFEELDVIPPLPRAPETDEFAVTGEFDEARLGKLRAALANPGKRKITVKVRGANIGRRLGGWISGVGVEGGDDGPAIERKLQEEAMEGSKVWEISINEKHTPSEQFVTLLHELGHLFCGHLGEFKPVNADMEESGWPDRRALPRSVKEIEAELVAWWLAEREGIITGSPLYLKPYLEQAGDAVRAVDLDRVTRAVARVRGYLGGRP